MAKYFGDLAKGVKDVLTGGLSYDNKLSFNTKAIPAVGTKFDVTSKGTDVNGSATATYTLEKDVTAEVTVNEAGVVKAALAHGALMKDFKASFTGEPLNINKTLKSSFSLLMSDFGFKADVSGVLTTPKMDASVCYNAGDVQLGAETTVCSAKGLTAWSTAAQLVLDKNNTVALVLADKADTVKLSFVTKLDSATTAAAEAVYKVGKRDLKFSAGAGIKLDNGHSVKAVVSSAGSVSGSYSGEVAKGFSATACVQVDQAVSVFGHTPAQV